MEITAVSTGDISHIAFLENAIEGPDAASAETLNDRLAMFPQGFRAARKNGRIYGYIESCIWSRELPAFQANPDFFSRQHRLDGESLYVIFVGVAADNRRHGVGSQLVKSLLSVARQYGQRQIQAVSRDNLVPFYESLGFVCKAEIPGFLADGNFNLMEKIV